MIPRWPSGRPGVAKRERLRFRNKPFNLSERMDPLFLGVLLTGALILGGAWFLAVRLMLRVDRAPQAQVQPIPDERILRNVRDGLPQRALLDGVFHADESRVYLSQEGGQIHSYDPNLGLWDMEQPYGTASPVNPRFTMLQSGCGGLTPCPEGEILWAIGEDGGLVRKKEGDWELIVSDTAFLGADASPVNQEDLTTAAISADGIWLAVGTKSQGFGLYSLDRHRWLRLSPSFYQPLSSTVIKQVVWWRGSFWFGGPTGLFALDMDRVRLRVLPDIEGEIMDLDADPEGDLWVLERKPCRTPGQNCQRLWAFSQPDGAPQIRLEEADRYPELSLARQHFAMQVGANLLLAGETGVYGYDTEVHRWERFHGSAIGPTFAQPELGGFYFGYSGGVGWRNAERTDLWPLEGERFARLTGGRDNSVLGLTMNGSIYEFKPGNDYRLIFSGQGTSLDPNKFRTAVAMGDQILLSGPEGVLLHDVRLRTYRDIKSDPSMSWLIEGGSSLLTSGEELYAIGEVGNQTSVKTLPLQMVRDGKFDRPFLYQGLEGPFTSVRAWDAGGIGFLDKFGRAIHLADERVQQLTGEADPSLNNETLVDVVDTGRDLLFVTSAGWRIYDKQTRSWTEPQSSPSGSPLAEVTQVGGDVYMRDAQNRLVRQTNHHPVLIGGNGPSAIAEGDMSDVWGDPSGFYMAGSGHLEYYDLGLRSITGRWRIPKGTTRILGEAADQPLALTDGTATWGDQILGPLNEPVLNMFSDETFVWTVRQRRQMRYLRAMAKTGELTRCVFRRPTMGPNVDEITDVRTIGDDVIVAATNAGLRFYDPRARSWFEGPRNVMPRGGWIFQLGDYLLFLERNQGIDRHWIVARRTIRLPDSCSDDRVAFEAKETQGSGTAVDEERGLFSWIENNGAVSQWLLGRIREILPAEPEAPRLSEATRWVYQEAGQAIVVVAAGELWRYAMINRAWERVEHRGTSGELSFWNLEAAGDKTILSVVDGRGRLYLGELAAGENAFEWVPVYQADDRRFGDNGGEILDIQTHPDGSWGVLLKDAFWVFNPAQRRWAARWPFASISSDRQLRLSFGRWICTTRDGSTWWVGRQNQGDPGGFVRHNLPVGATVALDENGQIWQLLANGSLQNAAMPRGNTYRDFTDYGKKPFVIDSERVETAVTWQGLLLFDLGGRLIAYDEAAMEAKTLPVAARNLSLAQPPLIIDGDLWLLGESRLVVLQESSAGQLIGFQFPGMSQIAVDPDGLVWAKDRNGWQFWRNGTFQKPGSREGLSSRDRIWVVDGESAGGISRDGRVFAWRAGSFTPQDLVLPSGELPSDPWGLHQGEKAWWAWGSFGIARLRSEACNTGKCLRLEKIWEPTGNNWPRSRDGLSHVQYSSANGLLVFSGTSLFIPSINGNQLTATPAKVPKSRFAAENDWDDLRANTLTLEGGGFVYNPVTSLENVEVSLVAKRPDGELILAERGEIALQPGATLDLGWLNWDPEKQGFQVNTPQGMRFFSAEDFVANGHLLFEEINAVIAMDDQSLVAANRHGLWHYKGRDLGVNQSDIVFMPQSLTLPIRADGRYFRTTSGLVSPDGKPAGRTEVPPITIGDITLEKSPTGIGMDLRVNGELQRGQATQRGFPWDRNRRHLVWDNGRLLLSSDAGLHDLERLENFKKLPRQNKEDYFYPEARAGVWLGDGRQWFALRNGQWNERADQPHKDLVQVNRPLWKWRHQRSRPLVELKEKEQVLVWQETTNGPGFLADQFLDAIADDKVFLVSSKAWLANLTEASGMSRFRGLKREKLGSARFSITRTGDENLIRADRETGERLRWVRDKREFEPAGDTQEQHGIAWESDRLRFQRSGDTFQKSIRLDHGWEPFTMSNGRFPFDVITAISATKDTLLLGSAAGLQIYKNPAGLSLNRTTRWEGLRGKNTGGYARVSRFERTTAEQPMRVFTNSGVFDRGDTDWILQDQAPEPQTRLRYQSAFWEWRQTARGRLVGRYLNKDGADVPVRIAGGRFLHDQLRDVAMYEGQMFSLWQTGQVSVGRALALPLFMSTHVLEGNPRQLLVLQHDLARENTHLPKGMYALGSSEAWRFEADRFQKLADPDIISALIRHANAPSIYEREHLRLRRQPNNRSRLVFEYRDEAAWRLLPWSRGGRLAIDELYHFHSDKDIIWGATEIGLVSFSRDGDGQLILQPHHFSIANRLTESQKAENITDLEARDGEMWVRIDADPKAIYKAPLADLRDRGFQKSPEDPFTEGVFISSTDHFWEWRWQGRRNGSAGVLQPSMAGEPITLSSGRFHFDGITSLALLQPGVLDFTTENGGWFETHRDNFYVSGFKRPLREGIEPPEIEGVTLGKREDVSGFCLQRRDGSYWWWVPGEEPEAVVTCYACVGDDGFWQYEQGPDALRIVSDGRDGQLQERVMKRGRFDDDRVLGMPIALQGSNGSEYLLPTQAGVLKLDENLRLKQMISAPFAGLPEGQVPHVLIQTEGNQALYIGQDGFRQLDGSQELSAGMPGDLPNGAFIDKAVWDAEDILRLGWRTPTDKGWHLLAKEGLLPRQANHLFLNIASYDHFISRRLAWGDPEPWLVARYEPGKLHLSRPQHEKAYTVALPEINTLLKIQPWQDRLLILGNNEILQVRLDRALDALFAEPNQQAKATKP